ncbi:hypothetical protein KUCAC02_015208 [Chaenocephalus aceratus]|uniref:Uncharacterized protein n=1 Tax=Chaenocephalus aceratus TaxID=36190 RepID=A0ACB9XXC7_CHAAC|nr:hypothetical protein KUCAC02_015208 [Chaenocephalus aceratus]
MQYGRLLFDRPSFGSGDSTVCLNHNKMTAVGCGSLTIALSGSSALKELDLSFNSLMDEGAVRIFRLAEESTV